MTSYHVYGALGSPYSMKVRAAMRAKRLPHVWTGMTAADRARVMPNIRPPVIPVIQCPDGRWVNDSTPFLLSIEQEGRALLPDSPVLRFAGLLLEDMADEWFMKAMFHYRWTYAEDQEWCANWLTYDSIPDAGRAAVEEAAASIRSRQISRMPLVGCTPETAPIIEASWKRSCQLLETMAESGTRFLFGSRISLADLAFFGQLKVMSVDPTPMHWLRKETPYLYRWLDHADDAGGIEGDWMNETDALGSRPLLGLLQQAGDTYLPFLDANAKAVSAGAERFAIETPHGPYEQSGFKYQARCLEALRREWDDLDMMDRRRLAAVIGEGAGHLD
jgi:glutathione S-transferase